MSHGLYKWCLLAMIINSVWIGKQLGPIHAACLRSFVRHGHDVVLHAYGRPEDTPKGVRLFDASKLMAENEIFAHKSTGSLSIASDVYRYRIQREGMGLYVDCDVYCVKRFTEREYIFSWESNVLINNAIIKFPYNSELLSSILDASEDPYFIPPWLPVKKQRKMKFRKMVGCGKHIAEQDWGVIGPALLTHHVKRLGLLEHTAPIQRYSPMYGLLSNLLYEDGLNLSDLITSQTEGLHLYNSGLKGQEIRPNTPMYEIINS